MTRCKYKRCGIASEAGVLFCKLHWKVLPNRYKHYAAYPEDEGTRWYTQWLQDAIRAIHCIELQFDLGDYPFLPRNLGVVCSKE